MLVRFLASVFLMLTLVSIVHAEPQQQSRQRPMGPESYSFSIVKDMVWGGGQYVAVGRGGLVMTSKDGVTWSTRRWRTPDYLKAVTWGNNQYIAVGYSGLLLISKDGITWKEISSELLHKWGLTRIRFLDGTFYAVGRIYHDQGDSNALFSSADGVDWHLVTNAPAKVADIAGGNGQRVIIARNGIVYRSIENGEWQPTVVKEMEDQFRGGEENRIVWNGRMYVASQELGYGTVLATSTDGLSWNSKEFDGFDRLLGNIIWNGRTFVAVCWTGIATTVDGSEWSFSDIKIQGRGLGPENAIAGSAGKTLITTSYSGYAQSPVFLMSEDGKRWKGLQQSDSLPSLGKSVTYNFRPAETNVIDEKEELAREKRRDFISEIFIRFAMSGLGLLLYIGLQIVALWKATGLWRLFALLPTIVVVPLVYTTLEGLWHGANLWPLGMILILPLVVAYLLFFTLVHWLYLKGNKPKEG